MGDRTLAASSVRIADTGTQEDHMIAWRTSCLCMKCPSHSLAVLVIKIAPRPVLIGDSLNVDQMKGGDIV